MKNKIKISLIFILILIFSNQYHKNTFNTISNEQTYDEKNRFTEVDWISSKKQDKLIVWGWTKEEALESPTKEKEELWDEISDTYEETCDNELLKIKINDKIYDVSLDVRGFEEKLRFLVKKHQVNLLFYDYYENIFLKGITYKGEKNLPLMNSEKDYFELTSEPVFYNFPASKEYLNLTNETIYYEEENNLISFFNQTTKKQEIFKLKEDKKGFFEHFVGVIKKAQEEITNKNEINSFNHEGKIIKLKRIPYRWNFKLEWWNGKEDDVYNKNFLREKNARFISKIFRDRNSIEDEINLLIKNELSHTPNNWELKRFTDVTVRYEYVLIEIFHDSDYIVIKDNKKQKNNEEIYYVLRDSWARKKDDFKKEINHRSMKNWHDFGYGSSMNGKEMKFKELFLWTVKVPNFWWKGFYYYSIPVYWIPQT